VKSASGKRELARGRLKKGIFRRKSAKQTYGNAGSEKPECSQRRVQFQEEKKVLEIEAKWSASGGKGESCKKGRGNWSRAVKPEKGHEKGQKEKHAPPRNGRPPKP